MLSLRHFAPPIAALLLALPVAGLAAASASEDADGEKAAAIEDAAGEESRRSEPVLPGAPDPVPEAAPQVALADAVEQADGRALPLTILGTEIPPGSYRRLSWAGTELFEGIPLESPVLVVNGARPGPTICLTAAVHGDELNGIEMVRRVLHNLRPAKLAGAVIGVPIVNLQGFKSGTRYLPDRRDLNRYFPGRPNGSAASRIAHSFFTGIVSHCSALIDLHTGSFERANLPQLRADMRFEDIVTLTKGFGATVILHSVPQKGTLRHEATIAGIPTVTLEAGGPGRLEPDEVDHGVRGIETLLNTLGMVDKVALWGKPELIYYRSSWVRADRGGILLSDVGLGSKVSEGDVLGTITDPITNAQTQIYAPFSGRVIGLARNQVVMPGFAAYHLGLESQKSARVLPLRPTPRRIESPPKTEANEAPDLAQNDTNGHDHSE